MASLELAPQYGCTLKIGREIISDEAIVIVNGTHAIAYVWNPESKQNEQVGTLRDLTGEGEGQNFVLKGVDSVTRKAETWKISAGRPCTSC